MSDLVFEFQTPAEKATADDSAYTPPLIRVEALICDQTHGVRRMLMLQQHNGICSMPGGGHYPEVPPIGSLYKHLSNQLDIQRYMIADMRLVALDSDIRPMVRRTKLVMVYAVTTVRPAGDFAGEFKHRAVRMFTYKEMVQQLTDQDAPFLMRRTIAAFNAAKFENPPLNLLCGNKV